MNNPHQALIEETKLKLVNTFVLSDDSWDVILQDIIDTVLEGERERASEYMTPEDGAAYLEALTTTN